MNSYVPTIEQIYNYYHLQKTFVTRGFYPKQVKDFSNAFSNGNDEFLKRFQEVIKRNFQALDWKIYIMACAKSLGGKFSLNVLGTAQGNKIYRNYIRLNSDPTEKTVSDIMDDIRNSLEFLKLYLKENGLMWEEYVSDDGVVPVFLNHIYAGSVSQYFYACFDKIKLHRYFHRIPDDVFQELFHVNMQEFIEYFIQRKHDTMIVNSKLLTIINKINGKFS